MRCQGVCVALLYAPINLTRAEDRLTIFGDEDNFDRIMKNDRREFIQAMMSKYPFYRERIGELVEDLYELCEKEQY